MVNLGAGAKLLGSDQFICLNYCVDLNQDVERWTCAGTRGSAYRKQGGMKKTADSAEKWLSGWNTC